MWIHQEETKRISYIDQLEIQISDGGYVEVGPEWYGIRECSPFSRLYYINGGKAWAQSGDETLEFTEGHMALIPLWHPYPHGCVESFQHLYFHFNLTKAGGLDLFSSLKQILILPMDKQAIAHMIQLYNSRNPADALTLTSFLLRDINTFISLGVSTGAMTYAYSETTEKVVRLIQERLSAQLTVNQLAKELSLSPSTLTKKFRAEVGSPLGTYIDTMLFRKCMHLLLSTDLPIGKIAEELEFCDQFYFSRFFFNSCFFSLIIFLLDSGPDHFQSNKVFPFHFLESHINIFFSVFESWNHNML